MGVGACASSSSARSVRCRTRSRSCSRLAGDEAPVARGTGARARDAGRRRQAASRHDRRPPAARCSRPTRSSRSCATPTAASTGTPLAARGMSSEVFAQRLRQDLSHAPGAARRSPAPPSRRLDATRRSRRCDVPAARDPGRALRTKDYLSKVQPTDAEIEAYYKDPAHAAAVPAPEQASIEYVVLDLEALKKDMKVSEEDLRKYYAENESRYTRPKSAGQPHPHQGRQGHACRPSATRRRPRPSPAGRGAQEPGGPFAELARKNSDDPGFGGEGRRPRLLQSGRDGQAVRGRWLRPEAGRDQRPRAERLRLPHHPAHRRARRRQAQLRSGAHRDRRARSGPSWRRSAFRRPRSTSPTWCTSSPTA